MGKRIADTLTAAFPLLLRYVGLLGAVYETVFEHADRPALLMLFGAMMGLSTLAAEFFRRE